VSLARIEAARGEDAGCDEHLRRARRTTAETGNGCLDVYVGAVLGLAALTRGDPGAAVDHLETAWERTVAGGMRLPGLVPFAVDLAEAHVRCGHDDRARELIASLEERWAATGIVYAAAGAHRCRGIMASDAAAACREFTAARELHAALPMPFELARTGLCEGEALRRFRHVVEARTVLREARRAFETLGAAPWADRATAELLAGGGRGRAIPYEPAGLAALTPQELQIARSVADGKNNSEAAASLYVSRKTVEAHLTRVYRKLGVRSRVELTRLLLSAGAAD
jgi:DNA-binding CsgD family transcriptional regulator